MADLTATIFALDQIRDDLLAYFTAPARGMTSPPADVLLGEWETCKQSVGPSYVIAGPGPFRYVGAAALGPGFAKAPNFEWPLDADKIEDATIAAPVLGARMQTIWFWVHGIAPGDFQSQEPGSPYAIAGMKAAFALSDVTWAALRDMHGHDLAPVAGKPLGPERGEFGYGSVLTWGIEIPIPVLGDTYPLVKATQVSNTLTGVDHGIPAVPGDTFITEAA